MAGAAPLLLFLLGALWVPPARAGSHSFRYFYSSLSEGLPGVPPFTAVGYVNDVEVTAYSSASRTCEPRAPWMGRVSESDPKYWEWNTANLQGAEAVDKANVRTAMGRHNQTAGLHVFQVAYGCELREDGGPSGGIYQWAYDGRDFVSLDEKHERYTPAMEAATITADRWNGGGGLLAQRNKAYLEQECIEWLRRYLDYGKERLQRRVPPQAMISRRKTDAATTLTCYAYGFYPRDIEMKWERNGVEVNWKTQTILPNTDGTYQIRTTVELPEGHDEKDYRCLVDHTGLEEIITKVYEEKFGTPIWLIVVAIAGVTLVALVIVAVIWKRNHSGKSNTAGAQGKRVYSPVLPGQDSSSSTNSV